MKERMDKECMEMFLTFLNKIKDEVSSTNFWYNLNDEMLSRYDYLSQPEFIGEFLLDYVIDRVKKEFETGGDKNE
jgi:hypothetical protein